MNTKNLLKAFFNYYQEQLKIIICLLPFCLLVLVLLPKPAKAGECACYTFSPFEEVNCFDTETRKECEL